MSNVTMFHRLMRLFHHPLRTLPSLEAYERWAATYPPHAHNALMELEQSTMLSLLPPLDGLTLLDLACGTGRYGLLAQERGAPWVLGVDNSMAMLTAAPSVLKRGLATTEAIPLAKRSVDGVICGLALGHLPQIQASMAEIGRILKPGGWALISDIHAQLAERGAQRTFAAPDGRVYAVEHYAHRQSDYEDAARAAGLTVDAVREPRLTTSDSAVLLVMRLRRSAG